MSPLTKIFVVLLVIVSLLQTAGLVVFVNRAKPLATELASANEQRLIEHSKSEANLKLARDAQAQLALVGATNQGTIQNQQAALSAAQTELSKVNMELAEAGKDKSTLTQQVTSVTQQLTWATATEGKLSDQVKLLRETNDKLVKQQEDDSRKIAELSSLADTMKAQMQHAVESLATAQDLNDKYKAFIKDHGLQVPDASSFVATGLGQAAISGLVVEKKTDNGETFVTINVGSVDNVQKGQEFNVLDRQGNFLGFAHVINVDNNYSIAKLSGTPEKIGQVQPNDTVKTQIRS